MKRYLFPLLFLTLLPLASAAQTDEGTPIRELHTVVVFMQNGAPYYRVLHQTDQKNLDALASGAIVVDGQGEHRARVIISPDGRTEGTRGISIATTSTDMPRRVLTLRDAIGSDAITRHEVDVQVCARDDGDGGCVGWLTATPYPEGDPGPIYLYVYDRMPPDPVAGSAMRDGGGRMNPDDD